MTHPFFSTTAFCCSAIYLLPVMRKRKFCYGSFSCLHTWSGSISYLNGRPDENIDNVQNTSCTALHN